MNDTIGRAFDILSRQNLQGFDIYYTNSRGFNVEVKGGKPERIKVPSDEGIAIRVMYNGKIGFAFTSDTSDDGIKITIECAKDNAKNADPDEYEFSQPFENEARFELHDTNYNNISLDKKIHTAVELEEYAISFDKKIKRVRKSSYSDRITQVAYVNSNSNFFEYTITVFSLSIMLVAEDNGDSQLGWDMQAERFFRNLNVETTATTAAKNAISLLGGKPIKTCRIPVIFENKVAAELIEAITPMFLGNNVLRGKSPFSGKLESPVASGELSVYDDPELPSGISSIPVDDEGTPTRRKPIIERGILKNYLLDIYSARKLKLSPTGNGMRSSFKSPPRSGATNIVVESGMSDMDELIKLPEKVLLITDAMGIHTVNPISGEFSIGISGLLYKDGELKQPVTGCTVAGTVNDFLRGIIKICNDDRWLGNIRSPSMLVKELTIAGE